MESIFKLSVMVNMIDNMTNPSKKIIGASRKLTKTIDELNMKFKNMASSGLMMAGIGGGIVKGLLSPISATFETKKALGELASVGIEDLKLLESSAKSFSDEFAGTTKAEFITSAYDIKSGISSLSDEGVAKFTKLAGLTAKATKSTTGEMTSLFATGYGIYKDYYKDLSDIEFGEMFSSGIAKAVKQFKTTGSEMAGAIERLGGTATSANVPLEEQLAVLGMLQTTMSGSEAGTKYTSFLNSTAKAGETLGIKFTDASNSLLPMNKIMIKLKGKFGDVLDASEKLDLQRAFGSEEAVKLIDLMYNKTTDLENNIKSMQGAMSGGTEITKDMANAINSTDGEKFTILKQKVQNLAEEIGNNMLPIVNNWIDKGSVLLGHISDFIVKNGELVAGIGITIVTITGLITAIGSAKVIFSLFGGLLTSITRGFIFIKKRILGFNDSVDTMKIRGMLAGDKLKSSFAKIKNSSKNVIPTIKNLGLSVVSFGKKAFKTAVTKMPLLVASVWSFTTALLANPITWVVVGIVALISVIVLLYLNLDKISSFLKTTWNKAVQKVIDGWNFLKNILMETPNWLLGIIACFNPFIGIPLLLIKNWDSLKNTFSSLWISIKDGFNNFMINFIPNLLASGKKIMATIGQGIKSAVMHPVNAIKGGFTKLRNLLPFSDAKEGPLSNLTLSGSKIPTTIAEGINRTKNVPSKVINDSFKSINNIIKMPVSNDVLGIKNIGQNQNIVPFINPYNEIKENNKKQKSISIKEIFKTKKNTIQKSSEGAKNTTNNINISINMKDLNGIKSLMKLLDEINEQAEKSTEFEDAI